MSSRAHHNFWQCAYTNLTGLKGRHITAQGKTRKPSKPCKGDIIWGSMGIGFIISPFQGLGFS